MTMTMEFLAEEPVYWPSLLNLQSSSTMVLETVIRITCTSGMVIHLFFGLIIPMKPRSAMNLKAYNNIFAGAGTLLSGSATTMDTSHNWRVTNIASAGFVNAGGYNYHLTAGSPEIDGGTSPGTTNVWYPLTPVKEYKHPSDSI